MQPEEQYDVPFCDLCNASVPLQDLESGVAVRHGEKTIGACCLAQLRQGGAGAAQLTPAAEGSDGGHGQLDARLLPLSLAMLFAVAVATIWLDFRIAEGEARRETVDKAFQGLLEDHAEAVHTVSEELDGVPRRAELDSLGAGVHALKTGVAGVGGRLQSVNDELTQKLVGLERNVKNLAGRSPRLRPCAGRPAAAVAAPGCEAGGVVGQACATEPARQCCRANPRGAWVVSGAGSSGGQAQ